MYSYIGILNNKFRQVLFQLMNEKGTLEIWKVCPVLSKPLPLSVFGKDKTRKDIRKTVSLAGMRKQRKDANPHYAQKTHKGQEIIVREFCKQSWYE